MPLTRRQVFVRRRVAVFGALAIVLAILFYLPLTLLAPLPSVSATPLPYSPPTEPAAVLAWPHYGGSAIGEVGVSGLLGSSGNAGRLPIASITKIVTALVVLEAKPLAVGESGPTITFTSADVQLMHTYLSLNGKIEPVQDGQKISEFDVLQVALIASANNYARSLVDWAFGSEQAFLPVAHAWLTRNGLNATTLDDSTGMSPHTTSTTADLVALAKIALAQPVIASIVSTKHVTEAVVGDLSNSNGLLGSHGVIGLKTGTSTEAGSCLLFAARFFVGTTAVTIVGVVLGGVDHPHLDNDIVALLASVKSSFHEVRLAKAGQSFATITTLWGTIANVVARTSDSVIVWSNTPISIRLHTIRLSLGAAGTPVGTVDFSVGKVSVSVPLALASTIEDPGPGWRLAHPADLF